VKWDHIGDFIRVQKVRAKKLYENGEIIYLCPCNLRPGEPWKPEVSICLTDGKDAKIAPVDFDSAVDMFVFYNCNHRDGHYPAYYIKKSVRC